METFITKGRNRRLPVNVLEANARRGSSQPTTHPAIELGGIPQIPEACAVSIMNSEEHLSPEQLAQCDAAIAAATEEMTRRRKEILRCQTVPAASLRG